MNITKHAVVIPVYQKNLSQEEIFSIKNAVLVLASHDIYFVGPEHLKDFLLTLSTQFEYLVGYKTFEDRYFESIAGYNRLMLSSRFYSAFEGYQYILIAQTDSLVFKDELNQWAGKSYSYIGAPWFEGYTQPTLPLRLTSVGNGGFSLRNVSDFLRVLNKPRIFKNILMQSWPGNWLSTCYRYIKDYHSVVYRNTQINLNVNEDLFWGTFVPPCCSFFQVPPPEDAIAFAFEAHPEYAYLLNDEQLPFGCHAWSRYNPAFWQTTLAKHGRSGFLEKT
jgi:hypothetical protein